jgi:hypothetical protein
LDDSQLNLHVSRASPYVQGPPGVRVLLRRFCVLLATFAFLLLCAPLAALNLSDPSPFFIAAAAPEPAAFALPTLFPAGALGLPEACPRCMAAAAADRLPPDAVALPLGVDVFGVVMLLCIAAAAPEPCFADDADEDDDDDDPCRIALEAPELWLPLEYGRLD